MFVLGAGAVGLALAAALTLQGREALLVRARPGAARGPLAVEVRFGGVEEPARVELEQVPLSDLGELSGTVALAVKSHANLGLAAQLAAMWRAVTSW